MATKIAAIQADGPAPAGVKREREYAATDVPRKRKKRTMGSVSRRCSDGVRRLREGGRLTG
ncbi:MAG TPA: hypothetical protein DEO44_05285 [Verrucomicrobia subdivision 6 bacterium]|nr:hypothetical protein [Verrucomicrobia subdivision 6 bacterium]